MISVKESGHFRFCLAVSFEWGVGFGHKGIENMGMAQKIRILLVKQGNISEAELARRLNTTSANLHQKMKRDNFSEKELREIGEAVGCDVNIVFIDRQTREET